VNNRKKEDSRDQKHSRLQYFECTTIGRLKTLVGETQGREGKRGARKWKRERNTHIL